MLDGVQTPPENVVEADLVSRAEELRLRRALRDLGGGVGA
jgi:hypothetical protein